MQTNSDFFFWRTDLKVSDLDAVFSNLNHIYLVGKAEDKFLK